MKKIMSLVLALCLCLGSALALAEDDTIKLDEIGPEIQKLVKEELDKIDPKVLKGFEDVVTASEKLNDDIAKSVATIKADIAAYNKVRDEVLEKIYEKGVKIIEDGAYAKIGDTGFKIWVPSVMKPQTLSKADEEEGVILSYLREGTESGIKVAAGVITDKDAKEIEKLEDLYDYYALTGNYSMNYLTINGRNYLYYTLPDDNSTGIITFTDDGKALSIKATPYDDLDLQVIAYAMFLSVEEDAADAKAEATAEPAPAPVAEETEPSGTK